MNSRPTGKQIDLENSWVDIQNAKGGRELTGILGHTSGRTKDRYAHVQPATLKEASKVSDEPESCRGLQGSK